MSEQNDQVLIETAMSIIATQIDALNDKDIDMFKMCFTDEIQAGFNDDLWNAALKQHERIPLSLDMIDPDASEVQTSANIKLVLKNGRTLCNLVKKEFDWLVSDIYWRLPKEMVSGGAASEGTASEGAVAEGEQPEGASAGGSESDETLPEGAATEGASTENAPAEEASTEDAPSEEASTEDAPSEETSTEDAPSE